jgi:GNAT superfamily N-acetyltransferase
MPASLTLRPATPADIPHAYALLEALYQHEQLPVAFALPPQQLEQAWFGLPVLGYAWLATLPTEPTPVGLLHYSVRLATFTGQAVLHIEDLMVTPAYQGQGIGRALLGQAYTVAKGLGAIRITLELNETNTLAEAFYRKQGFAPSLSSAYSIWSCPLPNALLC